MTTATTQNNYINFNNCDANTAVLFDVTVSNCCGMPFATWSIEFFSNVEEAKNFFTEAKARWVAAGGHPYDIILNDMGLTAKGLANRMPTYIKNTKGETKENFFRPSAPAAPKKICRRSIMRRAHEIARSLEGDRAAVMSEALKMAWAEAKA